MVLKLRQVQRFQATHWRTYRPLIGWMLMSSSRTSYWIWSHSIFYWLPGPSWSSFFVMTALSFWLPPKKPARTTIVSTLLCRFVFSYSQHARLKPTTSFLIPLQVRIAAPQSTRLGKVYRRTVQTPCWLLVLPSSNQIPSILIVSPIVQSITHRSCA